MIQEIFPHRFDNHYLPGRPVGEDDVLLHYNGSSVLLKKQEDRLELPRKKDFPGFSDGEDARFLFTLDEVPCFLAGEIPGDDLPGFIYKDISFFRSAREQEIAWVSLAGLHLANWYRQNKFCGKCGAVLQQKPDERALACPDCHSVVFPRISPAIIVAIVCGNKILLARGSDFTGNWYALIAGYVDVGESLEEALVREVKEEVGLDVRNIRYYKSQPWPLSGSMMIGFTAEADDTQPLVLDRKELAEAAWFTRGELPEHALNVSIAGEMIEKFESGEL